MLLPLLLALGSSAASLAASTAGPGHQNGTALCTACRPVGPAAEQCRWAADDEDFGALSFAQGRSAKVRRSSFTVAWDSLRLEGQGRPVVLAGSGEATAEATVASSGAAVGSDDAAGLAATGGRSSAAAAAALRSGTAAWAAAALKDLAQAAIPAGSNPELATALLCAGSLLGGASLWLCGLSSAGLLLVYFGAQTGFSAFMKIVLSNAEVSETLGLAGFPAGFILTVVQQAVTFVVCLVALLVLWVLPCGYRPRVMRTPAEWGLVMAYGFAFAANHAFNFFAIALLSVSLNLVIRSSIPLAALVLQTAWGSCLPGKAAAGSRATATEVGLMLAGVLLAAVAARAQSAAAGPGASESLGLGVLLEVLSVLFAALNLVLAGVLGSSLQFNALDATLYSAVPSTLVLLLPVFFLAHRSWPGQGDMTDWEVFLKVLYLSPRTIGLVLLSGVFSACYSLLIFALVRLLSAGHIAFAGNFNRALTILYSLLIGLEQLPRGHWGLVMLLAVAGNTTAFTLYSRMKAMQQGSWAEALPSKAREFCGGGGKAGGADP